jgi:hypothetical protein
VGTGVRPGRGKQPRGRQCRDSKVRKMQEYRRLVGALQYGRSLPEADLGGRCYRPAPSSRSEDMPAAPSAQFSPTPGWRQTLGTGRSRGCWLAAGGNVMGLRDAGCGWQRLAGAPEWPYSAASEQTPGGSSGIASEATNRSLSVGQRHFLPTGWFVFHVKHKPTRDPLVLSARCVGTST